ncbi:uncharacterized protein LOC134220867 isoform X2 [Armigeres subalbatus]|uniref:uncharacterized protein LOC134203405 isoform X1 n=1 Tax=Armigeres subalbatus TaxID=124917 RepID=UPI002ED311A8
MTRTCIVRGCKSRAKPKSNFPNSIKFFHFPKIDKRTKTFEILSTTRRKKWCKVLGLVDHKRFDYHVVCSLHFVTGQSAKLNEDGHVDWVPSLYLDPESASHIPRYAPKQAFVDVPCDPSRRQFDYSAPTELIEDESDDSYEYDITEMVKERQDQNPQQALIIENNRLGTVREVEMDFTNDEVVKACKAGKLIVKNR